MSVSIYIHAVEGKVMRILRVTRYDPDERPAWLTTFYHIEYVYEDPQLTMERLG